MLLKLFFAALLSISVAFACLETDQQTCGAYSFRLFTIENGADHILHIDNGFTSNVIYPIPGQPFTLQSQWHFNRNFDGSVDSSFDLDSFRKLTDDMFEIDMDVTDPNGLNVGWEEVATVMQVEPNVSKDTVENLLGISSLEKDSVPIGEKHKFSVTLTIPPPTPKGKSQINCTVKFAGKVWFVFKGEYTKK
jgi:hypothetical protein